MLNWLSTRPGRWLLSGIAAVGLVGAGTYTASAATTKVHRYEAEDAELGGFITSNKGKDPAVIGWNVASGGKGVNMSYAKGGWMEWRNVDGGSGGIATLAVQFTNGGVERRYMDLWVNGQQVAEMYFPSSHNKPGVSGADAWWGKDALDTATMVVELKPGANVIRFTNPAAYAPHVDFMDVKLGVAQGPNTAAKLDRGTSIYDGTTCRTPTIAPTKPSTTAHTNTTHTNTAPASIAPTDNTSTDSTSTDSTSTDSTSTDSTSTDNTQLAGASDPAGGSPVMDANPNGDASTLPLSDSGSVQAEDGLHNLTVSTAARGFHGEGYVTGWTKPGGWLQLIADPQQAGRYDLHLRYSTIKGSATRFLAINGVAQANALAFPDTKTPDNWQTVTIPNVELQAGTNVVMLMFGGPHGATSSNDLNIDELSWTLIQ